MTPLVYFNVLNFQRENLDYISQFFKVISFSDPDEINESEVNLAQVCFAPLGFSFDKQLLDKMPHLRVLASNTTGIPHIDMVECLKRRIAVISLKDEQEFLKKITSTAEHTMGLIFSLIRHIPWAFDSVKKGVWNRRLFPGERMLSRMSLGIIGLGRLGTMVAKMASAFGMEVRFYDPFCNSRFKKNYHQVISLKKLFEISDIISVHAPSLPETKNLINEECFNSSKQGSYFINTARAELVDHQALLQALKNKRLNGAALDVFPLEYQKGFSESDLLKSHPLYDFALNNSNLLLTPHIGGSTVDAWYQTERYTIDRVVKYLGLNEKTRAI